jgi:hypothetical protein
MQVIRFESFGQEDPELSVSPVMSHSSNLQSVPGQEEGKLKASLQSSI